MTRFADDDARLNREVAKECFMDSKATDVTRKSFAEILRCESRLASRGQKIFGLDGSTGPWGLALSGGGIRSATFALGVIGWLLNKKRVSDFDYLSTVSGGGYIGGWLTALLHRCGGQDNITPRQLAAAIEHLRRYSNYLTPHTGLLSLDTLAGAAIYVRNLLLNGLLLMAALSATLYAPVLLSSLSAWCVDAGHHIAAILAGLLFFWVAFWVGYAGPGPTPPDSRMRRERWAGPAIAIPLLAAFLLVAHGMTGDKDYPLLAYVGASMFSYFILSAFAYLVWRCTIFGRLLLTDKDRQEQQARELLDSPASGTLAFRIGVLFRHVVFTLLAGAIGGAMLWAIHRYVAGPLATWETFSDSHLVAALLLVPALLSAGFATLALHVAMSRRLLTEHDREWGARWMANGGRLLLLWWLTSALVAVTPSVAWSLGQVSWAALLAWLVTSAFTARFGNAATALSGKSGIGAKAKKLLIAVGPYAFVLGALMGIARLNFEVAKAVPPTVAMEMIGSPPFTTFMGHLAAAVQVWNLSPEWLAVLFAVPAFVALLLGFAVDVNLFSFQSFYRNRLTRCYLGASRFPFDSGTTAKPGNDSGSRTPHEPTDLDPRDDLRLSRLVRVRPYPIINTALNLNAGAETAWQERKAASFVFTPLFCGFQLPLHFEERKAAAIFGDTPQTRLAAGGYRWTRSYLYKGVDGPKLGLPIAVSGAAFTSNAGFHTTPWMTFLLTVFGVRLGRWCSNPGLPKGWTRASPWNSLGLLIDELRGHTREDHPYLYLSDGGHFENLGIYELVRRRCMRIVAVDAAADRRYTFDDLANAIHKCRVDFGVEITFPPGELEQLRPDPATGRAARAVAVGTIHYTDGKRDGTLVYIKPVLTGGEPLDVTEYHLQHPAFPQESTLDQWFGECQFESYRRLGEHIAERFLSKVLDKRI
jgi:hypothetical protein